MKARNGLVLCGRVCNADNGKVDVGVVVDHALDRAHFARDERRAPADRAVDGVVVRHGKTVRRDEEGAGVGGRLIGLDGLLVREKVKAENGGEVAVGGLAGGQRLAAQTERFDGRGGAEPLREQTVEQRAAILRGIGQRGERRFKEIAARERALERTGDKADAQRGPRRAASKLRAAAERAQQHGAPELCIQRAAGAVFAPVDQVMKGTVVHRAPRPRGNTCPAAAAAVGLCGFLRAEQTHEQRGGLLLRHGVLGGIAGSGAGHKTEGRESLRGARAFALQRLCGGEQRDRQRERADEGQQFLFHGIPPMLASLPPL